MKLNNILKLSALASLMLVGCDDMFEPNIENNRDFESMLAEPKSIQGLIMNAYSRFNDGGTFYSNRIHEDLATSDFHTNVTDSRWLLMGRGSWTTSNNPVDKWSEVRQSIQYINLFLQNVDKVTWAKNADDNERYKQRLRGEAYALRGIHNYFFLRAHAGYSNDGEFLGIPILTEPEDVTSDFNVPRQSFQTCLDQIFADLDEAIKLLPEDYTGDDRVTGQYMNGLINGRIVKAVKSQVALMVASPLYTQAGSTITWKQAADLTAELLSGRTIVPNGNTWYCNVDEINSLRDGECPDEVLWRGDRSGADDISYEEMCYPPSLYGNGEIVPTQNLVDAFPTINGYPINDPKSGYDPANPYSNRDPRLDLYIIHDGSTFKGATINTCTNSETTDGKDKETGKSTSSGYYLKKFMIEEVSPDPNNKNGRRHYKARIRYTELFLNYAEAQNEAEGPQAGGTLGMSPYEIVKAIRERGGIKNDEYLESIKADKDKMRELIRNERRIELMGENHRFWDLRRWNEPLNETVYGINITASGSARTYNVSRIDDLRFADYMYYGPIPATEVIKWSNLKQNKGWN
ncbi:MAG: RagB/SusD family nutrient uptake outer membrane protein [Bacteroidales bacterium]|nr:RagB/SusD family nutrient uptake outer membrane protein [Bacteroidales bacterium]